MMLDKVLAIPSFIILIVNFFLFNIKSKWVSYSPTKYHSFLLDTIACCIEILWLCIQI